MGHGIMRRPIVLDCEISVRDERGVTHTGVLSAVFGKRRRPPGDYLISRRNPSSQGLKNSAKIDWWGREARHLSREPEQKFQFSGRRDTYLLPLTGRRKRAARDC
jgi:hypothetical protein